MKKSCIEFLEARFLLASVPLKPSNLSAALVGTNVALSWLDNSTNETGFKIERSLNGTVFGLLTTTAANAKAFTDKTTAVGRTYTYRVRATNSVGDSVSTAATKISVTTLEPTPFGGSPIKLPATIQAENFDNGGQNIAFLDTDTINRGGVYRQTPVDVASIKDGANGYGVGYVRAGEWLSYTVSVPTAGSYGVKVRVANGAEGGAFHVEVDGVKKTGSIVILNTGSWTTWSTLSIGKIALPAGQHELKLKFDSSKVANTDIGTINWITVDGGVVTPTAGPFTPTNTIINPAGPYQVNLAWEDASENELGFKIERRIAGGDLFITVGSTKAGVTTFVDNTVSPATSYEYQIRSYNAGGSSLPTIALTATTVTPRSKWAWKTAASSPVGRYEAAGGMIDGKLYVFGGYINQEIHATPRSDVFDPVRNTWTQIGDMPVEVTHAGQAIDGSNFWIAGGFVGDHPGDATSDVWKYDTIAETWTRGPSLPAPRGSGAMAIRGRFLHFVAGLPGAGSKATTEFNTHWILNLNNLTAGWRAAAPIPTARGHLAAISLNNKVYAIGGQHLWDEDLGVEDDVDVYDPATNRWTKAAPLPKPLSHTSASTFIQNGKIVVVGGATSLFETSSDVYTYDPATNIWTAGGKLPSPRLTPVAGVLGNQIVVATGSGGSLIANRDVWTGVPSKSWDVITAMPVSMSDVSGAAIGNTIYVVGGQSDATLAFNVSTNQWTSKADLAARPIPGDSHSVETVGGKLFVIGGLGASAGKVQIFNPLTNTWTLGADVPFVSGAMSSCVLGGQIYVAGGIIGSTAINKAGTASTNQVARYNPLTNKWTVLPSMPLVRSAAGFGNDGKRFYIFGGKDTNDVAGNGTDSIQIFDPAKNTWTISPAVLPAARANIGRAVYFNGEFYLAGGESLTGLGATNGVYSRVDVFNPINNTWRIGTAMPTARQGVTAVQVAGRLYAFGGGTKPGNNGSVVSEVLNLA